MAGAEGRMKPYVALTVCQPYAEFIAQGVKPMENRTWPTRYRGDLLIHAGKSRAWLMPEDDESSLVFGAIVAIVDLYDCVRLEDLPRELRFHDHANGPWCWLVRNVRRIAPVPARGAQGLWAFPAQTFEYLERQS